MAGEHMEDIRRFHEKALHLQEVLGEDSYGVTEMDALEIEWAASLSEVLPDLAAAYLAGDLDKAEREEYERLLGMLAGMEGQLRQRGFAVPEEVLG